MTSEKKHQYLQSTIMSDATDDEKSPLLYDDEESQLIYDDEESQLPAPPQQFPYTGFIDRIVDRLPARYLPPLLIAFYVLAGYSIVSDIMVFRGLWEKGWCGA